MAGFAIPLITAGISGLAGLFGGGKQQQTSGNFNNTQQQSGFNNTQGTTMPVMSDLQTKLAQLFSGGLMKQYNEDQDLSGYTAGGLKQINSQGDLQSKATANLLAARGLSFSPTAAVTQTIGEQNRLNQGSSFLNSIPLLQRQMKQQALQGLVGGFSALPTGQMTNTNTQTSQQGTTSGNQTGTVNGNPMGGLFGGIGAGIAPFLGSMWGKQQFPNLFGGGGDPTMKYNGQGG